MAKAKAKTKAKPNEKSDPLKDKAGGETNEYGKLKLLNKKYQQRITWIKNGHVFRSKRDYVNALDQYLLYLECMAEVKKVEIDLLHPKQFDPKREAGEIAVISQVYWELCKIYDMKPKFRHLVKKALKKFIVFSKGFKHQAQNSSMISKYMYQENCHNKADFQDAAKKVYKAGAGCYICTFCLSREHWITVRFQEIKLVMMDYKLGDRFVDFYYYLSPKIISTCGENKFLRVFLKGISLPFIYLIAYTDKLLGVFFKNKK